MKTRSVNKWVEALRSGEYRQSSRQLKLTELDGSCSYCCLGVAVEVFNSTESDVSYLKDSYYSLGLYSPEGYLKISNSDLSQELTSLNDDGYYNAENKFIDDPLTFDEIADVILISHEEGWLGPKGVGV